MSSSIFLKSMIEAALFAESEPLSLDRLLQLFEEGSEPSRDEIQAVLDQLSDDYQDRGVELVKVASGYRFQAKQEFAPNIQRLHAKKPPRYSRALLETLALIIYRQ